MATQQDIDALTQQVTQVQSDLAASSQQIQSELDSLSSANPQLDVSALEAAVAPLDGAVKALGQLSPQQAQPGQPAPASPADNPPPAA